MHGLATSHPTVRESVREVFTISRTQAMPLRARQSLWQLHSGGMPVGDRTGGDGFCPVIDAMRASGSTLARARETHEQLALRSPTALLVWQHITAAWLHFAGGQWAVAAAAGQPDLDATRALMLGVRPSTDRTLAEPFALLRGLTVLEIVSHRHATWLALRDGVEVGEYDHVRAAAAVYERIRTAYRDALRGDWCRCELLQRQMRKAGLPASSCFGPSSPLSRWRHVWEDAGVCSGDAALAQHVLPERPLTPLTPAGGLATRRLCPRAECAPPDALPPLAVQVYVAAQDDGSSFGLTFVHGGDVEYDLAAQHAADAAGHVPPDARTPTAASLFAAVWLPSMCWPLRGLGRSCCDLATRERVRSPVARGNRPRTDACGQLSRRGYAQPANALATRSGLPASGPTA